MGTSDAAEEAPAKVECVPEDQEAILRQLLLDDREELKQLVTVVVARHVERNAELDDSAAYCQRQLNSALAEQAVLQERLNLLRPLEKEVTQLEKELSKMKQENKKYEDLIRQSIGIKNEVVSP